MPGIRIKGAYQAYERFCNDFWPGHVDDQEATYEPLKRISKEKRINFNKLPDDERRFYGMSYVGFLLYQYIYRCHSNLKPEKKFEMYLFGVIQYLDVVSGFELEIMKYLLWEPKREIHLFPDSVQSRYKKVKDNFGKSGTSIEKCRYIAFDRTMDAMLLKIPCAIEDHGMRINALPNAPKVEVWVGTQDEKFVRLCHCIHSTATQDSSMGEICAERELELSASPYWTYVDNLSRDILRSRKSRIKSKNTDPLPLVDSAIRDIELGLVEHFESIRV